MSEPDVRLKCRLRQGHRNRGGGGGGGCSLPFTTTGEAFTVGSSSSSSKIKFQQASCIYKVIVGLHTGPA